MDDSEEEYLVVIRANGAPCGPLYLTPGNSWSRNIRRDALVMLKSEAYNLLRLGCPPPKEAREVVIQKL